MNSKSTILLYQGMRQSLALLLSVMLIPLAQLDLNAQGRPWKPYNWISWWRRSRSIRTRWLLKY